VCEPIHVPAAVVAFPLGIHMGAWAIGLDRRRPYDLVRKGSNVTVVFR
jgi:hypothetical protein